MLGQRIRDIRKKRNMKLNDLSEMSGLSSSYISQLERGLVEPSLSSLKKISEALETPIYLLMEESENESVLVKKGDRMRMAFANSELEFEIVSASARNLGFEPSMMVINFFLQPGEEYSDGFIIQPTEQIIIVEHGKLEVTVGKDVYELESGDSVYIKKNVPHKNINISDGLTSGFYIVSPPIMPDKQK